MRNLTSGILHSELSAEQLVEALAEAKQIHFAGHADAELYNQCTLAWVKNGRVELVDVEHELGARRQRGNTVGEERSAMQPAEPAA